MRFLKTQRIKRQSEFERFKVSRKRLHCDAFSLCFVSSGDLYLQTSNNKVIGTLSRIGIITSRKIGNAVARNACKRKLREIFRLNQHLLKQNGSYLVICRRTIINKSYAEIEHLFLSLVGNMK